MAYSEVERLEEANVRTEFPRSPDRGRSNLSGHNHFVSPASFNSINLISSKTHSASSSGCRRKTMPIHYRIDKAKGITYVVWVDKNTLEDWNASVAQQIADPDWPGGDLYLSDLRATVIDEKQIQEAAPRMAQRMAPRLSVNLQVAFLAPSHFEVADTFQQAVSKHVRKCMVFTNLEAACAWLGIDTNEADAILRDMRSFVRACSQES